ncbi:DUF4917 family protein [uncultured Paludibaculum sp.]|uniref:DUF4917 family protein n=1 Tax=uncultured Paludibaculum sp. TaxID=1765020 RepID=UPI002AAB38F6|nr:DUF4917 family protein [uncultured Paludibaculum sp.]
MPPLSAQILNAEVRGSVYGDPSGARTSCGTIGAKFPMQVLSFEEAMALANATGSLRHAVLLGNGFSIAFDASIFSYSALFGSAEFSASPTIQKAFEAIGTWDFERVIRNLMAASRLAENYGRYGQQTAEELNRDADSVKSALVEAISRTHPDHVFRIDDGSYNSTGDFVRKFKEVFTLNYDMLLYWTLVRADANLCRDGFSSDGSVLEWSDRPQIPQTIHFVHGGLHLFVGDNGTITKVRYRDGNFIMDQIRQRIMSGRAPIFVCEGTSEQKLRQIEGNRYLRHCFKRLKKAGPVLFVYGLSMADSDSHILDAIVDSSMRYLFVSIYGNPESASNTRLRTAALALSERRTVIGIPLEVRFYDAESVGLWKMPTIPIEGGTVRD